MKVLKIVLIFLCISSLLFTLTVPLVCIYMQSYLKGQIGDPSKDTQEILEQKAFWADVNESNVILYSGIVFVVSAFLTVVLSVYMRKTHR